MRQECSLTTKKTVCVTMQSHRLRQRTKENINYTHHDSKTILSCQPSIRSVLHQHKHRASQTHFLPKHVESTCTCLKHLVLGSATSSATSSQASDAWGGWASVSFGPLDIGYFWSLASTDNRMDFCCCLTMTRSPRSRLSSSRDRSWTQVWIVPRVLCAWN